MANTIKKIDTNKYEITDDTKDEKKVVDSSELERTIVYMEKEYSELGKLIQEQKDLLNELKKIK